MDNFLILFAKVFIGLVVFGTIFSPLFFGKPREPSNFWPWLLNLPFNVLLVWVLLKFIGAIQ